MLTPKDDGSSPTQLKDYQADLSNEGKCIFYNLLFSKKTIDTYLKLEDRAVCRLFLAFKYVFIVFLKQIRRLFIFVHPKSSKLAFKTGFYPFVFVLAGREY